jgi:hypothetical protein
MHWLASHGITLLSGIFLGAAGKYLGDLFTDQRHQQEEARKARNSFDDIAARMPDLLKEMRNGVLQPEMQHVRDFFVIPTHADLMLGGKAFVYRDDGTNDYLEKARILEDVGYVVDVTPRNAPMFRMTESFVDCLTKWRG